uniref:Uncharacterized protein n=1 Tax=Arundo donax TaxID=35708 RepID=A0A0A8ZDC2_ARUDO
MSCSILVPRIRCHLYFLDLYSLVVLKICYAVKCLIVLNVLNSFHLDLLLVKFSFKACVSLIILVSHFITSTGYQKY